MNQVDSRHKLTVLVPCKDERLNIRPCIESFRDIADEILIADSGSTDGTLEIVQRLGGCRVIEREYRTSGDFKNWAIPQATHDWVLLVDADERVTAEMRREIQEVLQAPQHDGYWIHRDNHFMGHRIRYSGWQNDRVLRLFKRDLSRYEGPSDHGEVQVSTGRVGRLRSRFLHYTYWTYAQYFRKFERYTTVQAEQWHQQGKQGSFLKMLLNPILRFLRAYILQRGFLDGSAGLQLSLLAGFYSFTKQARLWQLRRGIPQPDPEIDQQSEVSTEIGRGVPKHAA